MEFSDFKIKVENKNNILDYPILSLAFIGDAVWSYFVRSTIVKNDLIKVNALHKLTTQFVKAKSQSYVLGKLDLTEPEIEVVKRAKNTKTNNIAKHATEKEYKQATAFEALLGFLDLTQNYERLNLILNKSYDIIFNEIIKG